MDFRTQQEQIKVYIESHLPGFLSAQNLGNFDAYIDDFLDFDKYTKSRQLFYNFGFYNFDDLSNESESEDFEFSVYMVFRNGKSTDLKNNMLDYASAFYKMFDASGRNLDGIADMGIIQSVTFYPASEGNVNVKVAELQIRLYTEK